MTLIDVQRLCVAGLEVRVYRPAVNRESKAVVKVVYLLHGRCRSKDNVDAFARKLVAGGRKELNEERQSVLWVVTFDHRNHGGRVVDPLANEAWDRDEKVHNPRHAVDMYSIQLGTAKDISLLTDLLPSYFFPEGDGEVGGWGVVGISLGGHSAWLALCHDARIKVGVPIIGCPDYVKLMEYRAAQTGHTKLEPPHFPESLRRLVEAQDPVNCEYYSERNPFIGKKVLVLCGERDEAVPWSAGEEFVGRLEVGVEGVKRVKVYSGVGHKCTAAMEDETLAFLEETMLA